MMPTVGRIVHVFGSPESTTPMAAIVTAVHGEACINVAVWDPNGGTFARTSVMRRDQPGIQGTCWDWPAKV